MRLSLRNVLIVLAVLVAGLGLFLLSDRHDSFSNVASVLSKRQVDIGRLVYLEHCASCHGENLEGQPNWRVRNAYGRLPAPPHDESGHTWHHPDQVLFELTKYGPAAVVGGDYVSDMPGYEGILTDREIIAVLDYIKSTWSEKIQQEQQRRTEQYQE